MAADPALPQTLNKLVWMTKTPKPYGLRDSTPMTLRSWPIDMVRWELSLQPSK